MKISVTWRLVIAATLGVLALIVVSIIELIFSNPGAFALTVIALLLSGYAAWLIFTGSKKRLILGWLLLVLSGAVILASLTRFTADPNDGLPLIRIIVLSITYGILVGVLRHHYWQLKRAAALQKNITQQFKKPVLIVNPKSGDGRATKARIPQKAETLGIKVIITKKGDSIEGLARKEAKAGADVLGVSGGDGTLGAVAKVALEFDLPLVVLPGGTRCHFARDLGLNPVKIADALISFQGVERQVDVGDINGRIFLNNASFGLYADIVDEPGYREHKVAASKTVLRELLEGKRKPYSIIYTDNRKQKRTSAAQILVGVNEYQTLKLFELGHRENMDKGLLQITAVTELDDKTVRELMTTLTLKKFFTTETPENFLQWTTNSFVVESNNKKLVVGVDGERETYTTPVTISVKKKALRLIVPPEGVRPRTHSPIGRTVISKLVQGITGKID